MGLDGNVLFIGRNHLNVPLHTQAIFIQRGRRIFITLIPKELVCITG